MSKLAGYFLFFLLGIQSFAGWLSRKMVNR